MRSIFYSWQSDLPNKENRNLIEKAIVKSIKEFDEIDLDRDTRGLSGSPNIVDSIYQKISKSFLFLCDVTSVGKTEGGKMLSNSNVMIELGYAVKALGWDKIICINNLKYSKVDDLPFDIRQNRIVSYNSNEGNTENVKKLSDIIGKNIKQLYQNQTIYDKVLDSMKIRIDFCLLEILKKISNILFGTLSMSEGLCNVHTLIDLKYDEVFDKLDSSQFFAFFVLSDYLHEYKLINELVKDLHSSIYCDKSWLNTVLEIKSWIEEYRHLITKRFNKDLLQVINEDNHQFQLLDAKKINPINKSGYIFAKKINNKDEFQVLNVGTITKQNDYNPLSVVKISESYKKKFTNQICDIITISNSWLDITNAEFILDPNKYVLQKNR